MTLLFDPALFDTPDFFDGSVGGGSPHIGPLPITGVNVNAESGVVALGIGETRRDFVARIAPRLKQSRHRRPHAHHGHLRDHRDRA